MAEPKSDVAAFLPPSAQLAVTKVPPAGSADVNRLDQITDVKSLDDWSEKKVDEIEMIGEELAAGFQPKPSQITPGMRYLHCSRTIHQLVTDRNRAVGIYLAVASLLWTASTALLNVKGDVKLMLPLATLQYWSMPVTLATCTVLAVFTALLLVRTRVGLIYEVAKMNVLLGLPIGRVQRVNVLSIFFLMQAMVSLFGAASGALFVIHLMALAGFSGAASLGWGLAAGFLILAGLLGLYVGTVLYTTSDKKLDGATK